MEFLSICYDYFLLIMTVLAVVVFIILQFITAPYGMTYDTGWGASIRSNIGWMIMEVPVFVFMFLIRIIKI